MKRITLSIVFLIFLNTLFSQVTLEHTYPNSGFFSPLDGNSSFLVVKLEVDGHKYVNVNRINRVISFYNLNHSLWKTINYTAAVNLLPGSQSIGKSVLYISQHLFDNDDEIEFMYVENGFVTPEAPSYVTQIVNEDNTVVFTANNEGPFVISNAPQVQVPIYNTPNGTKMILSLYNGTLIGSAKVYSLGGTLSNQIIATTIEDDITTSQPYPNPAKNYTTINFSLPSKVDIGELVFYDTTGKEVKRFTVDRSFENIVISTDDLQAGVYYYNLQTSIGSNSAKKLIKIF